MEVRLLQTHVCVASALSIRLTFNHREHSLLDKKTWSARIQLTLQVLTATSPMPQDARQLGLKKLNWP